MDRFGKWEVSRELGEGGQGKVYLVHDADKHGALQQDFLQLKKSIGILASAQPSEAHIQTGQHLIALLSRLIAPAKESELGALKKLHIRPEERGYAKAKDRLQKEVDALSMIEHSNILKILDKDLGEAWFVGEYHAAGTLWNHKERYKGDLVSALEAFRPLVQAVAELHNARLIHRDIKPHNVFIAADGKLVLGDLGIVFFDDQANTRVTDSYENVGSRDWMPAWAMGMKIEDIGPEFDIFCLGKLLWFMLSGRSLLPLWYHHDESYELEKMFPADPSIKWAREILDKCIVEKKTDCTITTTALSKLVDDVLQAVKVHAQVIRNDVVRDCQICGIGRYRCVADRSGTAIRNFGLNPGGTPAFKIFTCSYCGHVDLFHFPSSDSIPDAWR